jgi:hypothetical protein
MKKLILILMILSLGVYNFFKEKVLPIELATVLPNSDTTFRPLAYDFVHDQKYWNNYFEMNLQPRGEQIPSNMLFDFSKFSYIIVYGRQLSQMTHSIKSTYFDDPSPSYGSARRRGLICVFAEYNTDMNAPKGVFIYRTPQNPLLMCPVPE